MMKTMRTMDSRELSPVSRALLLGTLDRARAPSAISVRLHQAATAWRKFRSSLHMPRIFRTRGRHPLLED